MLIRQAEARDYREVYELVKEAFIAAEHADGNEQDLVEALRKVGRLYLSCHWWRKLMANWPAIFCLQKQWWAEKRFLYLRL